MIDKMENYERDIIWFHKECSEKGIKPKSLDCLELFCERVSILCESGMESNEARKLSFEPYLEVR